jgi:hypothetical protein
MAAWAVGTKLVPYVGPSWAAAAGLSSPSHRVLLAQVYMFAVMPNAPCFEADDKRVISDQFGRCLLPAELKNRPQQAPTPVHEWALPRVPCGFRTYIKRDDMTGSTLSGNKVLLPVIVNSASF